MTDKPLFADVSHALHVSYLVLSLPPRQKSPFKAMLIQVLDSIEKPTRAQREWLAQLTGPAMDYDPDRFQAQLRAALGA